MWYRMKLYLRRCHDRYKFTEKKVVLPCQTPKMVKKSSPSEVTNTALKSKDRNLTKDQINTMKKTTEVSEHSKNVCSRLKSILNRDPCVTRQKFRDFMKGYGFQDFDLNEVQLTEYRGVVGKYLEVAEEVSICVEHLAGAVAKAK